MSTVGPRSSVPPRQVAILDLASKSGAWHTVISNSMYPFLPQGCRVRLEKCDALPRVGEILAVWDGRQLLMHRCIAFDPSASDGSPVVTRGDNVAQADQPWPLNQVLARVVEVRRDKKWLPEPLLNQLSQKWNIWRRLRAWLGRHLRSLAGRPRA